MGSGNVLSASARLGINNGKAQLEVERNLLLKNIIYSVLSALTGFATGKPADNDERRRFVFDEIPPSDFEITLDHNLIFYYV